MDFKQNCRLKSFLDGVQVDLWSPCGVQPESVEEGKVQQLGWVAVARVMGSSRCCLAIITLPEA